MPVARKKRNSYTLPCNLDAELSRWCESTGDDPADVIADLVDSFLDDIAAEQEVASSPAADAPPSRVTGRGQGKGFRRSATADLIAGLIEERRKIPGSRAAAS